MTSRPAGRVPVTSRPLVIASVMLSMVMVAIEATIVSTAMPQIIGQLGGLSIYAWVFSAFLLTQTIATVVFGKFSDIFGRRSTMLAGIGLFLASSVLCGLSWSMPSLIAFRFLQGIGAGAIQPIALTIVGDLYGAEERGKVQGYLASVWAISAVIGPLVGALIVEHASWSWIFWLNLPFGCLAALGFLLFLHEGPQVSRAPIDAPGLTLFTVTLTALMVALTEGGRGQTGIAGTAAALCAAAALATLWQERRAVDPVISIPLWTRRPVAAANAASLFAGMALIGLTTFLPMSVQGVLRGTPLAAGLSLTVMVLGWPLGATLAARGFGTFGLRPILLLGSALLPAGALAFVRLAPGTPVIVPGVGSFVMGFGMGLLSTSSLVLIQEIVPRTQRGSATASNVFSRNLGSTLGATLFGAVLNHGLARQGSAVTSDQLEALLHASTDTPAAAASREVLQAALQGTFWAVLAIACLTVVAASLVPAVPIGRPKPAEA